MQRALALAERGTGAVSPNPLVGCVIVNQGRIVGEGWHRALGQAHAEVDALRAAGEQARGATAYVNLEPCSHHGRTPPCTEALIAAGIRRLVYAASDPHPLASGGAERLRRAGIDVIKGVAEEEARDLNRFFFHHVATARPYVIAKTASSLDGRSATRTGHSQWITGVAARRKAHELRQAVDAILVGTGTVLADNPSLTVRLGDRASDGTPSAPPRHPLRVVLDRRGRIPLDCRLLSGELPGRTLVVTTLDNDHERYQQWRNRGHDVWRLPASASAAGSAEAGIDPGALLERLGQAGCQSVLLEGGPSVIGNFLDAGHVNEMWMFVAPMVIGGHGATPAIGGQGIDQLQDAPHLLHPRTEWLGQDLLIRGSLRAPTPN